MPLIVEETTIPDNSPVYPILTGIIIAAYGWWATSSPKRREEHRDMSGEAPMADLLDKLPGGGMRIAYVAVGAALVIGGLVNAVA